MRRSCIIVALAAVLVTGCGWLQTGSDGGRTRANELEGRLSTATVGRLVDHVIPTTNAGDAPARVVVGQRILGSSGGKLAALDARSCPAPADGACTPSWSRTTGTTGLLASDGVVVWGAGGGGSSGANVVEGTRVDDGTPTWSATFPYAVGTDKPSIRDLAVSSGHVLAAVDTLDHGTNRYSRTVEVLDVNGCGAPTCPAVASIPTLGTTNLATSRLTLYALVSRIENGARTTRLNAIGLDGRLLWQSEWSAPDDGFDPVHGSIVVRDDEVFFTDLASNTTLVFATNRACHGVPQTCPVERALQGTATPQPIAAVSSTVAMTSGDRLSWFDNFTWFNTCTASPCPSFASTASTGAANPTAIAAIAGDLVFATRGDSVLAYSADATTGCVGSPKVCSPLWTRAFSGQLVDDAFVWDARLYVRTHAPTTGAVHQHVFTLPD